MFMEKLLAIQNISSITGLSTYTLRYYENIGLLSNIERDEMDTVHTGKPTFMD